METVPKRIIATASLRIPSPKRTAFKTGNFSAFIREFAATVSVAQSTLLSINTSVRLNISKKLLRNTRYPASNTKLIAVPNIPKKLMIPKF